MWYDFQLDNYQPNFNSGGCKQFIIGNRMTLNNEKSPYSRL